MAALVAALLAGIVVRRQVKRWREAKELEDDTAKVRQCSAARLT